MDSQTSWQAYNPYLGPGANQNPQGLSSQTERYTRFLTYDVSDKLAPVYTSEHVVPLPLYNDYTAKASKNPKVASQSEMHALPNGQFLVLARDSGFGHGQDESLSVYRHIDVFDVAGATDVRGSEYDCEDCAVASAKGALDDAITPAAYCGFLDFNVNSELGKFGAHNGGDQDSGLLVSVKIPQEISRATRARTPSCVPRSPGASRSCHLQHATRCMREKISTAESSRVIVANTCGLTAP